LTVATLLLSEGQEAELSGSQLGNASERVPVTATVGEINYSKGSTKHRPPSIFSIAVILLLHYLKTTFTKSKAGK